MSVSGRSRRDSVLHNDQLKIQLVDFLGGVVEVDAAFRVGVHQNHLLARLKNLTKLTSDCLVEKCYVLRIRVIGRDRYSVLTVHIAGFANDHPECHGSVGLIGPLRVTRSRDYVHVHTFYVM
ncbi:hypothetical protein ALQ30_200461 [Pseudomonas syringae pv. persicae]|uniref:Uncharacterized protein n=1 Tax=Pseudomonas syringae pv. persicae TaxID=237306 RepID=A0A3M4A472_9PSED|nr:hypothetical protein ALQ30_200461 [Pseudomonas syringae pv. persicae]